MAVIGIDLGGTKVSAALMTRTGETICKTYKLLAGATGPAVGALVADAIGDLRGQRPDDPVEAVVYS